MVSGKGVLSFVFLLLAFSLQAQDNRYMIFFKDKQGTAYDISNPSEFLGDRALDRRVRQGIQAVEKDLPASGVYREGVEATAATVRHAIRWMSGALVSSNTATRSVLKA